jgi:hypothetical protein
MFCTVALTNPFVWLSVFYLCKCRLPILQQHSQYGNVHLNIGVQQQQQQQQRVHPGQG